MKGKKLGILALALAAILVWHEIAYAQIGAACMAARRVRKARQEEQQQEKQQGRKVQVQETGQTAEGSDPALLAATPTRETQPVKATE